VLNRDKTENAIFYSMWQSPPYYCRTLIGSHTRSIEIKIVLLGLQMTFLKPLNSYFRYHKPFNMQHCKNTPNVTKIQLHKKTVT